MEFIRIEVRGFRVFKVEELSFWGVGRRWGEKREAMNGGESR